MLILLLNLKSNNPKLRKIRQIIYPQAMKVTVDKDISNHNFRYNL